MCSPTTTTSAVHPREEIRRDDIWRGLSLIALMSVFIAPRFREKLNTQFMLGARNQSILIVGAVLVMRSEGFTVGMRIYGN